MRNAAEKEEIGMEKQDKKMRSPCIIKELLPAKVCYFAINGGIGCFLPYLNAFFVSIGLSVTQSGLIAGIRTVFSFIASPIIGVIGDHFRQRKILLLILVILTASTTFPLPWIAKSISGSIVSGDDVELSDSTRKKLFYVMLLMLSLISVFGISMIGFIDSAVILLVGKHDNASVFGYQRVFGPIGFAIASFLAGFVSDKCQIEGMSNYTVIFIVYLPFLVLLFIAVAFLDQSDRDLESDTVHKNEHVSDEKSLENTITNEIETEQVLDEVIDDMKESKNIQGKLDVEEKKLKLPQYQKEIVFSSSEKSCEHNPHISTEENKPLVTQLVFATCRQIRVIFFFLIIAHMGINFSLLNGFQAIFLEKELGTSKTVIGIASALSPMSEILAFPVSAKLINLFGGIYPSFIIATFSYVLRFLLTSFIKEPYLILPVQLFQFFGYAVFWAAAVEYTNKISPKEISATMFSIVTTLYYSFGNIIGNIVGGIIYEEYGGRWLFRASSINCALMTCCIIVSYILCERKKEKSVNEACIKKSRGKETTAITNT